MAFLQLSRFALLAGVFKCSISVRSVFQCIFWILTAVTSTYNQAWGLVVGSAEWCSWDCDVNLQPGLGQQSGGSFCEKVTHAAETDASGRRCRDDLTAQRFLIRHPYYSNTHHPHPRDCWLFLFLPTWSDFPCLMSFGGSDRVDDRGKKTNQKYLETPSSHIIQTIQR